MRVNRRQDETGFFVEYILLIGTVVRDSYFFKV
jgi:hypothetical protein